LADFEPGSNARLDLMKEEIIGPARPIIDPHHHLWKKRFQSPIMISI